MGGNNFIYRPDPALGPLGFNEIPTWDDQFFNQYVSPWTKRLAYDPVGEDQLPTLGEQLQCSPEMCEDLNEAELQALWQVYGSKFDGVFKRENGNYYFFRNPINESTVSIAGDRAICKDGILLPYNLTRTEAVVLELWTHLSEYDFSACDPGSPGEYSYKAVLNGGEDYTRLHAGLDKLIAALEWQKTNPGRADNPHNPSGLPLDISLEKVKEIRAELVLTTKKGLDDWFMEHPALHTLYIAALFGAGTDIYHLARYFFLGGQAPMSLSFLRAPVTRLLTWGFRSLAASIAGRVLLVAAAFYAGYKFGQWLEDITDGAISDFICDYMITPAADFLDDAWDGATYLYDKVGDAGDALVDGAVETADYIVVGLEDGYDTAVDLAADGIEAVVDVGDDLLDGAASVGGYLVGGIGSLF